MIVALGFPLNVAAIILGCIFSMLFSVFNALGPISNPTPPTAALTVFPCGYSGERPAIASFVIFDIFGVRVSVFLYAYYVYLMFFGRCD